MAGTIIGLLPPGPDHRQQTFGTLRALTIRAGGCLPTITTDGSSPAKHPEKHIGPGKSHRPGADPLGVLATDRLSAGRRHLRSATRNNPHRPAILYAGIRPAEQIVTTTRQYP